MGDLRVDLDTLVHRAGVHDEGVGARLFKPPRCDAVHPGVLPERREVPGLLTLPLYSEGHDHIGALQGPFHPGLDAHRGEGMRLVRAGAVHEVGRQKRGRRTEHHPGAHLGQPPQVGARHPAVENIADYGHGDAVDPAQLLPDRVEVQQGLGRVGVATVARVDYGRFKVAGHVVGGAGVGVADDDDVGVHRLEGEGGVVERLALLDAAAAAGDVDDVGAEYLSRLLEGDAGAGAGLVEQGDDAFAAQRRDLPDVALQHLLHGGGVVQDGLDLAAGEVVQVEDVATVWQKCGLLGHFGVLLTSSTSSTPSVSEVRTCTSSSFEVGTFLPT